MPAHWQALIPALGLLALALFIAFGTGYWLAWGQHRPLWKCPIEHAPPGSSTHPRNRLALILMRSGDIVLARHWRQPGPEGDRCYWVVKASSQRVHTDDVHGWFDVADVSADDLRQNPFQD